MYNDLNNINIPRHILEKNKTIKLDIDGVLRNMADPMVKIYNETFGTNMTSDDIFTYDVQKAFPKLGCDAFKFFFTDHALETIINAPIYDGAKEAVDILRSHGYKVVIVSYQPNLSAKIETLNWLSRHNIEYDGISFTNKPSKSIIHCDIIIDDNVDYLTEVESEYKVCIDQAYNKGADKMWLSWNGCRVKSLLEFAKLL